MSTTASARRWPKILALFGVLALLLFWGYWSNRPFPPDHINWSRDLEISRVEAYRTGRLMLIDFTADWCPPCRDMKRNTYPDPEVGAWINGNVLPVRVDLTQPGPMEMELAQRWAVQPIPVLILSDGQGREISRKDGSLSPRELLTWLKSHTLKPAGLAPTTQPGAGH